jgi:hypothetical protein
VLLTLLFGWQFYNGDGSKFVPFSFANLDKGGEMD